MHTHACTEVHSFCLQGQEPGFTAAFQGGLAVPSTSAQSGDDSRYRRRRCPTDSRLRNNCLQHQAKVKNTVRGDRRSNALQCTLHGVSTARGWRTEVDHASKRLLLKIQHPQEAQQSQELQAAAAQYDSHMQEDGNGPCAPAAAMPVLQQTAAAAAPQLPPQLPAATNSHPPPSFAQESAAEPTAGHDMRDDATQQPPPEPPAPNPPVGELHVVLTCLPTGGPLVVESVALKHFADAQPQAEDAPAPQQPVPPQQQPEGDQGEPANPPPTQVAGGVRGVGPRGISFQLHPPSNTSLGAGIGSTMQGNNNASGVLSPRRTNPGGAAEGGVPVDTNTAAAADANPAAVRHTHATHSQGDQPARTGIVAAVDANVNASGEIPDRNALPLSLLEGPCTPRSRSAQSEVHTTPPAVPEEEFKPCEDAAGAKKVRQAVSRSLNARSSDLHISPTEGGQNGARVLRRSRPEGGRTAGRGLRDSPSDGGVGGGRDVRRSPNGGWPTTGGRNRNAPESPLRCGLDFRH